MPHHLKQAIAGWDGKSAQDIALIFDQHKASGGFLDALINYTPEANLQKGATWLLKKYCENHGSFTDEQISQLYAVLPQLTHWESQLHLLQIMAYLPIPLAAKKEVEFFLRDRLQQQNKFVRAWAYSGFYELACQYPEYQIEAQRFMTMALRDEAASVKARIRQILKKGWPGQSIS